MTPRLGPRRGAPAPPPPPPFLLLRLHHRLGERRLRSGRSAHRQPGLRLPRLLPHACRRRQEGEGDLDALPPLHRPRGAGAGARPSRRPGSAPPPPPPAALATPAPAP